MSQKAGQTEGSSWRNGRAAGEASRGSGVCLLMWTCLHACVYILGGWVEGGMQGSAGAMPTHDVHTWKARSGKQATFEHLDAHVGGMQWCREPMSRAPPACVALATLAAHVGAWGSWPFCEIFAGRPSCEPWPGGCAPMGAKESCLLAQSLLGILGRQLREP